MAAAARFILRHTAARSGEARLAGGASSKSKRSFSSLGISKQRTLTRRNFWSPVEMSCFFESMTPFHTVFASALLNSMLYVSGRSYGWTPEVFTGRGRWLRLWRTIEDIKWLLTFIPFTVDVCVENLSKQ